MPDDAPPPPPPPFDPLAAGWKPMRGMDGYPALIGPFLARRAGESWQYGFRAEPRHLNKGGVVHGGMLMSFADDALGMTVWEAAGRRNCTTVQLNTQFVAPVRAGEFVESRAEVLRRTRTLIFVQGMLAVGDRTVIHADGIWKILGA
jgi:uncharacterized protein (TIGR00369 family)